MRINKNFPRTDFFSIFSKMERIRKGSDMPEKKWGSPNIQQKIFAHQANTKSSALYFVGFSTRCVRLKMTCQQILDKRV